MKNTITILFLSLSLSTLACDGGFFPDQKMNIPAMSYFSNNMTQDEYNSTIKKFELFFSPWIDEEHRSELIIYSSWETPTVNAFADQRPGKMLIMIYGGLARHKAITADGLTAILCHELGHHLGGFPKKSGNRWSSAEGQSDYYASMKCLRRLWQNEDNGLALQTRPIPQEVIHQCAQSYKDPKEQKLCQRMSLAGLSVALLIQDLDHDSITPQFHTPETNYVRSTQYGHPFAQCRLDTFFQGSICTNRDSEEFDEFDEKIGSCHSLRGDQRGLRPKCWFIEN